MLKLFEVREGKVTFLSVLDPKNIKKTIIAAIIIFIAASLSSWLKIDEKQFWKFYNIVIQQFGLQNQDPERHNKKAIEARIELSVDNAIERVTPEYDRIIKEADKRYQPRYVDEVNDEKVCYTDECKALAPPMRICASWVDSCPKE